MENRNEQITTPQSFESQFSTVKRFTHAGRTVEYVDVCPENLKRETPIIIATGWGEEAQLFKQAMQEIYNRGRRVIFFGNPRDTGVIGYAAYTILFPEVEIQKAESLLELLKGENIRQVDVVAHSQGALYALFAANIDPDSRFRNIALVAPAGLMREDSFLKLATRWGIGNILKSAIRNKNLEPLKGSIQYITKNPLRSFKEAFAIASTPIHRFMWYLKSKGIGVSVIHGVDDPVFPMNEVQKATKSKHLVGFYSTVGDHNIVYTHPEKYIPLVLNALDRLEARRADS